MIMRLCCFKMAAAVISQHKVILFLHTHTVWCVEDARWTSGGTGTSVSSPEAMPFASFLISIICSFGKKNPSWNCFKIKTTNLLKKAAKLIFVLFLHRWFYLNAAGIIWKNVKLNLMWMKTWSNVHLVAVLMNSSRAERLLFSLFD